ncbi:MAG: hypothetical protein Q6352_008905 [Candidatus Freyrarchaeum guaymaensis]
MRIKVLFDTSVLVAASTFMISEELSIELKHPFFDESMRLIGFIRKHLAKRIGIVTDTIENQAYNVLDQAVRQELKKKTTKREIDFEILSVILNYCENRLKKKILPVLLREPVDPLEVSKNKARVSEMYENLTNKAQSLPKPAKLLTEIVPRGFKKTAFNIYRTQDEILNSQLTNLLRNPADPIDQTILAEAIYLLNVYKQTEGKNVMFYIASTDYHFSPVRKKRLESREVTDTIKDLFGILCDWPHEIEQELKSKIK